MMFKLEKQQNHGGPWEVIGKSNDHLTIMRLFAWTSSREDVEAKLRVRDSEKDEVLAVFCHSGLEEE